jgi:hypothetical protein
VWYVFWDTPQHIPELLLAMMPPIMQLSMEEGSGPILYWSSSLCLLRYATRRRFTSPPMRPGSTVMLLPPSWIS